MTFYFRNNIHASSLLELTSEVGVSVGFNAWIDGYGKYTAVPLDTFVIDGISIIEGQDDVQWIREFDLAFAPSAGGESNLPAMQQTIDIELYLDLPGDSHVLTSGSVTRAPLALPTNIIVTLPQFQESTGTVDPGAVASIVVSRLLGGVYLQVGGLYSMTQDVPGVFTGEISVSTQIMFDELNESTCYYMILVTPTGQSRSAACLPTRIDYISIGIPLNVEPSITFTALSSVSSVGALAINGTAADEDGSLTADSFSVTVNDVLQTPTFALVDGAWSASVDVSATGTNTIIVTVTDSIGATASATQTTSVQALSIVTPTVGVSAVDEGPIVVTVLATPTVAGSTAVQLYDGANATGSPGTVATGATTADLAAGTHQITARMIVSGVEITSVARAVEVADQLPIPVITSHTAGQQVDAGTLSVWGTVTHTTATPTQLTVEFDLDDAFISATPGVYDEQAQRWEADLTVETLAAHTIRMRAHDATLPIEWVVATPVAVSSSPDYFEFDVGSAGVNPEVELAAGSTATVTWVHQGTQETLTGLSPTITSGAGTVRMYVATGAVDSSSEVRSINFGFESSADQGRQNLGSGYNHTEQDVTGVRYTSGLTGLENFLAGSDSLNGHHLTGELDLSACVALRHVECYGAQVTSLVLPTITSDTHPNGGATHRLRLCFEDNHLTNLDLNPVAHVLYDLRAAIQAGGTLTMAPLTNPLRALYHYCVRDQILVNHATDAQMPVIAEQWNWNTSQTGTLAPVSTALVSLQTYGNQWTSVDLSLAFNLTNIGLNMCGLNTTEVDAILAQVDAFATSGAYILSLGGNGGPSVTGMASAVALRARGWTVTLEAQVGEGVTSDDFNRADGAVGNGWYAIATNNGALAVGVISGNALRRTDTNGYQVYGNPSDGTTPANHSVECVVPHATTQTGYFGLFGRWRSGNGVRWLFTDNRTTMTLGNANDWNASNVTITADNGGIAAVAAWAVDQSHTLRMTMTGTLIELYVHDVLVGHGTVTTNATEIGTEYGICGEGNNRLWDSIGTIVT